MELLAKVIAFLQGIMAEIAAIDLEKAVEPETLDEVDKDDKVVGTLSDEAKRVCLFLYDLVTSKHRLVDEANATIKALDSKVKTEEIANEYVQRISLLGLRIGVVKRLFSAVVCRAFPGYNSLELRRGFQVVEITEKAYNCPICAAVRDDRELSPTELFDALLPPSLLEQILAALAAIENGLLAQAKDDRGEPGKDKD